MIRDLPVITSPANDRVKYAKNLQKGRVRHREGCYLLEGLRLIEQALDNGGEPAFSFFLSSFLVEERAAALAERLLAVSPVYLATEAILNVVADTETPQGIVSVFRMPSFSIEKTSTDELCIILDGVADPGNMGTILRCAQGSGFDTVLLTKGCVDPYSPKVVRAGMGAQEYLNVGYGIEWSGVIGLLQGKQIALAHMSAVQTVWDVDWTQPTALIIGNEAHGVSKEALAAASELFSLPMVGGLESLNAAMAASISMFEAVRQRRS